MNAHKPFLTAEWRNLVMLNYVVPPSLLEPWVPYGTELDFWEGRSLISLVGFQFLKTRIKGWAIPGHQQFEEVNLRFYVRRLIDGEVRRGVVFLKELVAKPIVSWVANAVYRETYLTLPMSHRVQIPVSATDRTGLAEYRWKTKYSEMKLRATFGGPPQPLQPGSLETFITEHYWGYTRWSPETTLEYPVEHPPWRVWNVDQAELHGDTTEIYGPEFAAILSEPPASALVADGSPVMVYQGKKLERDDDQETSLSCETQAIADYSTLNSQP